MANENGESTQIQIDWRHYERFVVLSGGSTYRSEGAVVILQRNTANGVQLICEFQRYEVEDWHLLSSKEKCFYSIRQRNPSAHIDIDRALAVRVERILDEEKGLIKKFTQYQLD